MSRPSQLNFSLFLSTLSQARRQAKSTMKAAFADERKRMTQSEMQRTKDGGAADIGRNGIKMRGGATAIRFS